VDRVTPALAGAVSLVAGLHLAGWMVGRDTLLGLAPEWVPMAPATAIGFLVMAAAVLVRRWGRSRAAAVVLDAAMGAFAVACAAVALTRVAAFAGTAVIDLERPLVRATESAAGFVVGRMSPLTALLFVLAAAAVACGRRRPPRRGLRVTDLLAAGMLAVATVVVVGYLYGAPPLYGGRLIPVALSTAVLFWVLAHALLFDRGMLLNRMATSRSLFARIVRVAIPISAAIVIAAGWVSLRVLEGGTRSRYVVFFSLGAVATASLITLATALAVRRVTGTVDRAERALREAQVRFRETLDAMLEGCQILDRDWRYVYVNHAAAAHGRRSREELLGRTLLEAYPGIEATPMFAALERCMRERQPALLGNRFVYPDGTEAWFDLSVQPCPEGVFVLSLDVTERTRQQEELRRHRDRLEELVGERTAALELEVGERRAAEERARRRAAQAEALNRELEAFSYSVSHDLRAPLRAVDGFSQALLEDCAAALDEACRGYLERIRANAQHMGELIDDLLRLSRVSRAEMARAPVDLTRLAGEVVAGLREAEPGRRVTVEVADGLEAMGDERLLRSLLANLLGNAWKFTRRTADARIEVGAGTGADAGWFFVRDNGAGFDMAFAGKLFGAFQRLHAARDYEGHGIGLATVQRVINRHGGRVRGEGEVGKGATFYFSLHGPGAPPAGGGS